MKIEELTECFDSITPTKEQKEKMLAGILSAKEETPVKIIKLNRYKLTSIAAVIAVGVFVAVYSNIGKNMIPQVDTQPTVENNDTSTYAVNDVQQKSVQEPLENNNAKPETKDDAVIPPADEDSPNVENGSLAEGLHEVYPELSGENSEDAPSVAMYFDEENLRMAPTPDEQDDSEDAVVEDNIVSNGGHSAGGGSSAGGGGGGGYEPAEYTNLTITEVMNHQVYSEFMPVVYPDKFNFYNAMEYTNRLKVVFKNDKGNYMSVSVFKEGEYTFYEQILTPEEIKNIGSEGYMNFAVKCGEYYVIYNIDTYDSTAVYDMVISSEHFNN